MTTVWAVWSVNCTYVRRRRAGGEGGQREEDAGQPAPAGERRAHQQEPTRGLGVVNTQ